jgi:bifunctional non-homologous end joining protein LigD
MPRPVKDGSLRVGGRTVQISSVAKPFFPEAGLTKGDLVAYYRDVAEVMLPHLAGRPLNLQRFPNGVNAKGFWQQGAGDHFPDWVPTVTVEAGPSTTSSATIRRPSCTWPTWPR